MTVEQKQHATLDMMLRSLAINEKFIVWNPNQVYLGDVSKAIPANTVVVETIKRSSDLDQFKTSRPVQGYWSTEDWDRQEEQLLARGLTFDEAIHYGWLNDNHDQQTAAILGAPVEVQLHQHPNHGWRWFGKGYLFENRKRSDDIWELHKATQQLGRRLGFSVEGKVTQRQGPRVIKATIRNVAITANPVNTACTWDAVAKAMSGHPEFYKSITGRSFATSSDDGHTISVSGHTDHAQRSSMMMCEICKAAISPNQSSSSNCSHHQPQIVEATHIPIDQAFVFLKEGLPSYVSDQQIKEIINLALQGGI